MDSIYVMNVNPNRPLSLDCEKKIRSAFDSRDTKELIHLLIQNEVFPVRDSYVGFLRIRHEAIDQNPITIERIGKRLYTLGYDALIREATRPKETNRQLGNSFKKWLPDLGYPVLNQKDFDAATTGTVILSGGDKQLANYAIDNLGCKLSKGIDLLIKKDGRYLIGEAKFLTTPGGEQNGGFADASTFIKGKSKTKVRRIAILDGYIWVEQSGGLHGKIVKNNLDIFSVLLLDEYVKEF